MARLLCSGCLCAGLVLGTSRTDAGPRGVSFGLRTGWAVPMGELERGDRLATNFDGMMPIWLDGGYRFGPNLYLGGYFQWGLAFVSRDVCPSPLECSAVDLRMGLNAHWHFKSLIQGGRWGASFDPWVGIGTGYESAIIDLVANGARSHQTNHGFEFVNLQLGGDYVGLEPWRLGGFVSLAFAEYDQRTHSVPTQSTDYAIARSALHLWFFVGVRGQYDL